jgi:hypothetical protein
MGTTVKELLNMAVKKKKVTLDLHAIEVDGVGTLAVMVAVGKRAEQVIEFCRTLGAEPDTKLVETDGVIQGQEPRKL